MKNQQHRLADGELALISHIRQRFTKKTQGLQKDLTKGLPNVLIVGIGDDAAVFQNNSKDVLVTTDAMIEGVHFDMSFTTPFQVGHKLVTVNVSDIYAMAAEPAYMLLTISIPPETTKREVSHNFSHQDFINGFLDGIDSALSTYNVALIGGDITSSRGGISVSATVIGFATTHVLRKGAEAGHSIYVTGNLGDSACGLKLLQRINRPVRIENGETIDSPLQWQTMKPLLYRHLMPVVTSPVGSIRSVSPSHQGRGSIFSAMMDISDGLSIDLRRLCAESNVGAVVYEARLPRSVEMIEAAAFLGFDPTTLALCGGEDYQILFTSSEPVSGAWCIGEITNSEFVFIDTDNRQREMIKCGYEHFKD
ncbi:MAG: thiamine-phosphate kinase [Nitrospirae bacterium]|nr:thiamine-phosphate kinase [Nitrospirota bacterium]